MSGFIRRLCGMEKPTSYHSKARTPVYPNSDVERFKVPNKKVDWSVTYEYKPVEYTAPSVLKGPTWADPDFLDDLYKNIKFNSLDGSVNRKSFTGNYEIVDNKPQNPEGRTGISGRGLLGKWGPNHAADPIVTRWKRDDENNTVTDNKTKKKILQFVAIRRKDGDQDWAIPGGMVDAEETVSLTLKREFGEEALNTLEAPQEEKKKLESLLSDLFEKEGKLIYKGYMDDPRNTDNSWMETVAVNFHDESGESAGRLPLNAGDDAGSVRWMDIRKDLNLYANHISLLRQVASNHDASW
ncbi:unnamed protein product [Clavelina lepadiformis]|uniref:Nudix hydrolase domain-containing protein n=1 Tax=Clavelina lepadiformis TaxID=159417 RepID=A0ABP0G6H7_CLALP